MLLAMGGFKVDGWVEGEGKRNGWIGGQREKVRGVYGWLSRFKLIRLRCISLATFAALGGAHNV